jgi:hypothetical protein
MSAIFYTAPCSVAIGGVTYTTLDNVVVNAVQPMADVQSILGGPHNQFQTAYEHTITFTPHGVVNNTNLTNFFPLLTKSVGSLVFNDSTCVITDVNGNVATYHNAAVTKQPTIKLSLIEASLFGSIEIKALVAKSGTNAGLLVTHSTGGTFDYTAIPTNRFSAIPKLTWYTSRTAGLAYAVGTLTLTGNAVADETVTIGSKTYTWKASVSTTANQVKVGASAAASITNLIAAVNGGTGSGTLYGSATVASTQVIAAQGSGTSMTATARIGGTAANSYATTDTMTNATWGAATLAGGTDQGAANAQGYVASPADKGWFEIETSNGITITPSATLVARSSSAYGNIANYAVTDSGASVEFVPVDLTNAAFRSAQPSTVGGNAARGNIVITADGGSGLNMTITITACSYAGSNVTHSNSELYQGSCSLRSNVVQEGGILLPELAISIA